MNDRDSSRNADATGMTNAERDRLLKRTSSKVDDLHKIMYVGNGKPSVMQRISSLESIARMATWLAGIVAATGAAALAAKIF